MKPQTANAVVLSVRCAHRTPGGRQCRLPASDAGSGLCPQHRAQHQQMEAADHYPHLTRNYHDFQTAQGINHSLHSLYELLAQNRISPRRAAVLAYINSLLLRTLPQIDADNAAGIKFPPKNLTVTKPQPATDPSSADDFDLDSDEDSDVDSDSESDTATETETQTETETGAGAHLDSTNTWDPSIPEPDPKKKPS